MGKKSYISARDVPLPESVVDLDVDSVVTPDDSISQVGVGGRSTHSHRSHRSHSRPKGSRADEAGSQVSRASQKTAKAGEGSRVGSRRGSQVA